jgi:hypothetical protein
VQVIEYLTTGIPHVAVAHAGYRLQYLAADARK